MKDFEEFRLEEFNRTLPRVKELVDVFFEVKTSLKPTLEKYNKKLEELKRDKEALEKISAINDELSKDTRFEVSKILEKKEKEITETEELIEETENKIDDLELLVQQYKVYLVGVGLGFSKNNGKILEKAENVKVEYIREYFFLMFCLCSNYEEQLLSKEAMEYICKCLLENEEEDVANRKIAVLRGDETLLKKDFLELFK